jgi:hypothetical protein
MYYFIVLKVKKWNIQEVMLATGLLILQVLLLLRFDCHIDLQLD